VNLLLQSTIVNRKSTIVISGSKSEANRLLILKALYPNITLENISNSDDSEVLIKALLPDSPFLSSREINIHHAGTAMRFLTAYFAIQELGEVILTGSSRMKERPIGILVDALKQLGAEITYEEKEGFPPIKIIGKKLTQNKVSLLANVSSQFITSLLLIAPKLENGLELTLIGEITSLPYIKMTLALLNQIGIETSFEDKIIKINQKSKIVNQQSAIESDWSSASYYYSIIALSEIGTQITLSSFKKNSLQADSILAVIYKDFGVETIFHENNSITITKSKIKNQKALIYNLNSSPDIAQTIAVTCFGLGIGCHLTGLHTLNIKETNRLFALKIELTKLGAVVAITDDSLKIQSHTLFKSEDFSPLERCPKDREVSTYQDHRMAMAFAPLALKTPIIIENAEVVSKSYPHFWEDLKSIGFQISEI
jgi:3-phosphoshikimate 1-carboxyvinyltransferase